MKLYQALKRKNELVGEIRALETTLIQKNSRNENEVIRIKLNEKVLELDNKRNELVELKTKISKANFPIQEKIFKLAELKAEHKFFSSLPTREGEYRDSFSVDGSVKFVVFLNEQDVERKCAEIKENIKSIQESLDYYNHTTDID